MLELASVGFGDLRSVAHRRPTARTWRELCSILDRLDGVDLATRAYVEEAADVWPDHHREAPLRWLRAWQNGEPSPWLHIARRATLDASLVGVWARRSTLRFTYVTLDAGGFPVSSHVRSLLSSTTTRALRHLSVHGAPDGLDVARTLATTIWPVTLESLSLRPSMLCSRGMRELTSHPSFRALRSLTLESCRFGAVGARELAGCGMSELERLTLDGEAGFELRDLGARAIASGSFPALTTLRLRSNHLGDDAARALASSALLPRLDLLDLSDNVIGDEGAHVLAQAARLARVRSLKLGQNRIGPQGRRELARALGELTGIALDPLLCDGFRGMGESWL